MPTPKMLTSFREHAQYRFDDLFSRGPWGKFLLLLIFTVCVLLFGMLAWFLGLFSPENDKVEGIRRDIDGGFWDTLWWSAKHIVDPSFFSANYGASLGVIGVSLLVSIAGMVIFGTLIGFISSGIEERIEALRRGNSVVKEAGHALILGWNAKALEIVGLIAASRRRPTVVILAPREVPLMDEALRASGAYGTEAKLVLRSGSPANRAELDRVACADARSVIVLSTHAADGDADIEAVKTLLALAAYPWRAERPKIACEIAHPRGADIARAAWRAVPVVSSGEVVSRLIFQASRQSGIAAIYDRICSPGGVGIFFKHVPGCAGMRFGDAAYAFPEATLIGVSSRMTPEEVRAGNARSPYRFTLAPLRRRPIAESDWLVFLARSAAIADDLAQPIYRSEVSINVSKVLVTAPAAEVYVSGVVRSERYLSPTRQRLLVLGWNANVAELLAEHDACVDAETEATLVSGHDRERVQALLAAAGVKLERLKLMIESVDVLAREALPALRPETYDGIVVLADDSRPGEDADARTVMSLVLLKQILEQALRDQPKRPRLVAEILDPENAAVVAGLGVDDLVISPRVISQQLVQISEQQMLAEVYRELLSSGGVEIYLKPASRYVMPGPCLFKDLVFSSQRLGEVALGVRIAARRNEPDGGLELNPAKNRRYEFAEGDMVVVLAEELYDRSG